MTAFAQLIGVSIAERRQTPVTSIRSQIALSDA